MQDLHRGSRSCLSDPGSTSPDQAAPPDPGADWIYQSTVASALGISQRTASLWAREGRLRKFEHGVPACGRRKYSRRLVERELQMRWDRAVRTQDELLAGVNT